MPAHCDVAAQHRGKIGGADGGARWAVIASLVETCKMNRVDPQLYFTDLLTRLVNGWRNNRVTSVNVVEIRVQPRGPWIMPRRW